MEIWRDIPGFESLYQASNFGRIRSLDRVRSVAPSRKAPNGFTVNIKGAIHRGRHVKRNGKVVRILVGLRRDGRYFYRGIHELVLLAFIGPRPDGAYGCHKDDAPTNNRLTNLYWGTPTQNCADKIRNGNQPRGTAIPWSKLTDDDVRFIRANAGVISQSKLAAQFGITQPRVSMIVNGKNWAHVALGMG